ncbi:MAG: hypothetical protein HON23_05240 [Rickettsiales bacterium]|jgi:hypothetical protein|nr:hypothetical protein [Rickettsiales bacterium]
MIIKIKTLFNNLRVKTKLLIIILTVSLVCTSVSMLSISVVGLKNIKNQIETELLISGKLIANRVNAALEFNNNSSAIESLNALQVNKSISRACIYNKDGAQFASYFAGTFKENNCPAELKEPNLYKQNDLYSLYRVVSSQVDNTIIGHLFIETNLDRAHDYVQNLLLVGLIIFAAVILIAFILANLFQKTISRPIQYLVDTSSESAHLSESSPLFSSSKNELVKLEVLLRGIISKINSLEEQNVQRDKVMESVIKNSESTIGYLSNELKHPLEATIAFGDIISSRAIGDIDPEYIAYYNDVYLTVFYFYGIINDTMSFFKSHLKSNKGLPETVNVSHTLTQIISDIKSDKPDYLQKFNIICDPIVDESLPDLKLDNSLIKELLTNAFFVFSKYQTFLEKEDLRVKITAKKDIQDGDAEKFRIEIECEGLEGESIANVLENHRDYQNDVHLLRSKLQYMKYLASYDGGYLDFGNDLRKMSAMVIFYPWQQVFTNENNKNDYQNQSLEASLQQIVKAVQ